MNSYFQFKQFIIHQDKTAMKVCTDACILGAWVAAKLENKEISSEKILDIGCGTGLLSLMLAQKSNAIIDSVEINENAFLQAKENITLSPWKENINLINANITEYTSQKKYDLIICNPPFFVDQLKSVSEDRNTAMHATELSFSDLAICIKNKLAANGTATLLLPYNGVDIMVEKFLKEKLYLIQHLKIGHSPIHPFFRSVLLFSKEAQARTEYVLSIKNNENEYSDGFKKLMTDYYLHL